ncbi:MAG: tyrosine--tRNA ligase [Sphingobacteriales bacterium]|nr:MAG: tyrosine--tRNA ligase [Sphingobacteriales bacterium]
MDFVEELRWRGMLQDIMPGTQEQLNKEITAGYIGFDPTADSLHVGHLVQVMTLIHFQRAGHKPFALVGGATGMVGDPSGKSAERNLLSEEILFHNVACIEKQLQKFLDFDCGENSAEMVNNYDWFKGFSFLEFIRDVGKHITVNYMMAKDSVKKRLEGETGMSFTEFSYQLVQGYDFYYLWKEKNCIVQMGGSDQWGNIVTGTELIRRKNSGTAYAITTQLIKKADGTKFGKTESGAVWLDREKTSPYKFYQFWMNVSDADAKNWIRIFSLKSLNEISQLEQQHDINPGLRILQKALAEEITIRTHSVEDYNAAVEISGLLFRKDTIEQIRNLDDALFNDLIDGLEQFEIPYSTLAGGVNIVELLATETKVFPSKGEARKMIQGGGVSVNKEKIASVEWSIHTNQLLKDKYLLVQKGKNNYYIIICT